VTNQKRGDESQPKSGRRVLADRRKQNEEPHDPERRDGQERRTQADRRENVRYYIDHYPVELIKPDGTKLNAFLNDISYKGFQIMCTGLTARILSQKTGLLTEDDRQDAEILINIPFKEGIEKILVSCKLIYIANDEDAEGENTFAVGLHVENFKGQSVRIINRLIEANRMANKERRIASS